MSLINQALAPDRAALEECIRQHLARGQVAEAATHALKGYGPEILGYLAAILRDPAAANDVFSDFSEDLWKGIARFRQESTFRTWAYRLAWNAAQMFWRDPYRKRTRRLETREYSLLVEEMTSLAESSQVEADRLTRLRERLGPDEQTLLILRVDKDLSWKEIASVLTDAEGVAIDAAALRKRFERIKERLHRLARKEGLVDAGPD